MRDLPIRALRGYENHAKNAPFPFWTLVIGIALVLAGWRFGWF